MYKEIMQMNRPTPDTKRVTTVVKTYDEDGEVVDEQVKTTVEKELTPEVPKAYYPELQEDDFVELLHRMGFID